MHKQIFVFNDQAYVKGTLLSAITSNALNKGIITGNYTEAYSSTTPISITFDTAPFLTEGGFNTQPIYIAGYQYGSIFTSPEFRLKDIKTATKIDYTGGQVQQTKITPTVESTNYIGDEYIIRIINTTVGTATPDKYNYTYVATTANHTAHTVIDGLVALINVGTTTHGIVASATDGDTKLMLAGQATTTTFRVACDGAFATAPVDYSVQVAKPGSGTTAHVTALETECWSKSYGVTQKTTFPIKVPTSIAASNPTHTYTLYVFDIEIPNLDRANQGQSRVAPYKLIIAENMLNESNPTYLGKTLYDYVRNPA